MTIWQDKRIVIFGAGASGLACARYFSNYAQREVVILDAKAGADLSSLQSPFEAIFGEEIFAFDFCASDVLVVSPGIALNHKVVVSAKARGAQISSDVECFLILNSKPVIGITGSNGKSTVTAMAEVTLKAMGINAVACGNIGLPVMQAVLDESTEVFVVELSSFQLERLPDFSVDVATLLNVSEDHMDRYDSFEQYVQVKQTLLASASKVVVNVESEASHYFTNSNECLHFGIAESVNEHDVCAVKTATGYDVFYQSEFLLNSQQLKIQGRHNVMNTLAVIALVSNWISNKQSLVAGLTSFAGLPHRCQWVASINGVDYINDSKATNVGATVVALESYAEKNQPIVLIVGGQGKDGDFSLLKSALDQYVSHTVLIGEDAPKIAKACGLGEDAIVSSLSEAVNVATQECQQGSIVLLSPACASFDMFTNYQARGDAFVRAVQEVGDAA